jgi:hypothetical protein
VRRGVPCTYRQPVPSVRPGGDSLRLNGAPRKGVQAGRFDSIPSTRTRDLNVLPKSTWLVICSCGWERECFSEWSAESVARLHPKLGEMGLKHDIRVEAPQGFKDDGQLPLT